MSFWQTEEEEEEQESEEESEEEPDSIEEQEEESIQEQIVCFKAEYAFQMSQNSQLQSELEKVNVRIRRRQAIVEYYDDYIFNYVFDENNNNNNNNKFDTFNMKEFESSIDIIDIDKDYKNVIHTIQYEEIHRLEQEEDQANNISSSKYKKLKFHHQSSMTVSFNSGFNSGMNHMQIFTNNNNNNNISNDSNLTRMRSKSAAHVMHANILYEVSNEDQIIEKNWMKELRKKKFKIFVNRYRKQRLNKIKKEYEKKLQELEQQINIKNRIQQLNHVKNKLEILKKSRIIFIKNASKELDQLRNVIHNLTN